MEASQGYPGQISGGKWQLVNRLHSEAQLDSEIWKSFLQGICFVLLLEPFKSQMDAHLSQRRGLMNKKEPEGIPAGHQKWSRVSHAPTDEDTKGTEQFS